MIAVPHASSNARQRPNDSCLRDGNYRHESTSYDRRAEYCYSIHRQEHRYVAKLVSGTGDCFEGEIVFK